MTRQPAEGQPLTLRLGDRCSILWWGPDEAGDDRVATTDGVLLAWEDVASARASARRRGLPPAKGGGDDVDALDFAAAESWLREATAGFDPVAALNLWNLAGDVALSLDEPWEDGGPLADRCYAKLTGATQPWLPMPPHLAGEWTEAETAYLRDRLHHAITLLNRALGQAFRGG